MLYFELRNRSKSTVNHLSVTFYDSTMPILEEALAAGNLAEDERVELEYFLYKRPAFLWLPSAQSPCLIAANQTTKMKMQAHGKRGLTSGTAKVSYGFKVPEDVNLYQRRIEFSLTVTVNASLELIACDILPCHLSASTSVSESPALFRLGNDSFLLALEMRNPWINPLIFDLNIGLAACGDRTISFPFLAGQGRRVILTLPRHLLNLNQLQNPLPGSKKDQQFVLSLSTSQITAQREAWWHRHYILDSLCATWRETAGDLRNGNVELRGIRLSERHVRVIGRHALEAHVVVVPIPATSDGNPSQSINVTVKNNEGNARLASLS